MFNCQFVKLCLTSYCLIVVFSVVHCAMNSCFLSVFCFFLWSMVKLHWPVLAAAALYVAVTCAVFCIVSLLRFSLPVTRMMQQESRRLHQIGRWVISYMTKPKIFRLQFTSRNDELISNTSGSWAADLRTSLASPAIDDDSKASIVMYDIDSWVWGVWVWCVDRQGCTSQRSEMLCSWSRTSSTSRQTDVTAGQSYTTSFMYACFLCAVFACILFDFHVSI